MSSPPETMRAPGASVRTAAGAVSGVVCIVGGCQAAFCSPLEQGQQRPALRHFVAHQASAASPLARQPRQDAGVQRNSGLAAGAVLAVVAASLPRRRVRGLRSARRAGADEAPELKSERDIDYSKLNEMLASNDFRGADEETRRLVIQLGGPAAVKRGWVYFAEVKSFPEADLQTIDSLWQHYSKGKFGWAVQRKIWRQNREQFDKFALEVSWFTDNWKNRNWPDEFIYSADAPAGHLPLTNCIRGAQVLQELLAHPAFAKKKAAAPASSTGKPGKRSALSMLALGRAGQPRAAAAPIALAGASVSGLTSGGVGERAVPRAAVVAEPECCYKYKAEHLAEVDNAKLLELRKVWINDLELTPLGNKDVWQKSPWEKPMDGGAITEDLLDEGKVDVIPSQLNLKDVAALASELSSRTVHVEKEVRGKKLEYEIFFDSEFEANGDWWFDVEVTADQQKSSHRVIVGKDMMKAVGAEDPKEVLENAIAILLFKKLPRNTDGIITAEVFRVNYFTAANVAEHFPEFLELFGKREQEFDNERNQWNFKQVHDYSQDDKRTIPTGPSLGVFHPAAFV